MRKFKQLLLVFLIFAGTVGAMQQDDLGEQLLKAALQGKAEIVTDLLDRGVSIHYEDRFGWTALIEAANNGRLQVVQLLLERGAAVNHATKDRGQTALWRAATGNLQLICEVISDHMMKIPNDAQRKKIYLLLLHLRTSGFGRDICYIMKPHLQWVIDQENREHPEDSVALREIKKLKRLEIPKKLIEKYTLQAQKNIIPPSPK